MTATRTQNRRAKAGASKEQDKETAVSRRSSSSARSSTITSGTAVGQASVPSLSVCFDGAISMLATPVMEEQRGRSMIFGRRSMAPRSTLLAGDGSY